MIWLAIALLAAASLAPTTWASWRGARMRGRRDAALALHRAQLTELDRDLAEGRLLESEHAGARLEVQRRLLGDAALTEAADRRSGPLLLVTVAACVPAAALLLYVWGGHPDYRARQAEAVAAAEGAEKDAAIVAQLRAMLTQLDPKSDRAREGFVILGRAELSAGHLAEAADAWRQALATKYEPALAAETAEAITEASGRITPEAADLFKRALADGPADAPWRKVAEQRMAEAGKS